MEIDENVKAGRPITQFISSMRMAAGIQPTRGISCPIVAESVKVDNAAYNSSVGRLSFNFCYNNPDIGAVLPRV